MSKSAPKKKAKSCLLPLSVSSTAVAWLYTTEEYRMFDGETDNLLRSEAASQCFRYDATGVTKECIITKKNEPSSGGRHTEAFKKHPREVIEWFAKPEPESHKVSSPPPELGSANDFAPASSVLFLLDTAAMMQHPNGSRWSNPLLARVIKNHWATLVDQGKMIVIVSHTMDVPQELEHTAVLVEHPLPDSDDLARIVRAACNYFKETDDDEAGVLQLSPDELDTIVGHIQGMRLWEADNILARSVHAYKIAKLADPTTPKGFDIATIRDERIKAVRKNSTLEVVTPRGGMEQVGGHSDLKAYARRARKRFTKQAAIEGLSAPRGILLMGYSGTGKSLLSGCIAGEWEAKILRGDVSACKGGLVGQSENAFRKMLKDAESQAGDNSPVILQLDEAGKMFGGGLKGGQNLDSGVSTGMSAIYLTWRQECKKPVYVIMTANEDAQNFPMEWLRPGRIDKVFFVDLPNASDREEIFRIHLNNRNWPEEGLDVPALAAASDGYTPAEIEQIVENAIDIKWEEDGDRPNPLKQDHLLRAIQGVNPMSISNKQEMSDLRQWAADRGYTTAEKKETSAPAKPRKAAVRKVGGVLEAAATGEN